MTEEIFRAYFNMVVEKAFKKGVAWEQYQVVSMDEAIKEAQKEILKQKIS